MLDMSPTLDPGALAEIRARGRQTWTLPRGRCRQDHPYCSAESPEYRAIGGGDIILGFSRMIEAAAAIGCRELWVSPGNFKAEYPGRLANDRFRTDVTWGEQLRAIEMVLRKLAPVARDHGVHLNMETHDEITSFEILRLIEAVGDDCTGVVFDTANGLQRGEHPVFAAKRSRLSSARPTSRTPMSRVLQAGSISRRGPAAKALSISAAILPILARANPGLTLSLEITQSAADRPRRANPRQCIEIEDPVWRAAHPDLSREEHEAYLALIDAYEARIRSGEVADWETYEATNYGYPTYQQQNYRLAETLAFIDRSARHIRAICAPVDEPPLAAPS